MIANDAEDGVIVGFGAAAGKDQLLGTRAQEGDLFASGFDRGAGALSGVWIEAALPKSAEK
jgi:hypothetical protein